jgi:hypothetical protein
MKKLREFLKNWKCVDYNSNNAWGFGGLIGKMYTKGSKTVYIGETSYRHIDGDKVIKCYTPNGYQMWFGHGADSADAAIAFLRKRKIDTSKSEAS